MNNLFQQQDLWLAYHCGNTTAAALSAVWFTPMTFTQQLKYMSWVVWWFNMQNFLRGLQILKYVFSQVIDVSESFCIIVVLTLPSTLQCLNIAYFLESKEPGGVLQEKE